MNATCVKAACSQKAAVLSFHFQVTAALGLVAQSKENETKRLSEVQLVMEATSQGLKGHINKLEQMCLSLQESVQSLRAALSNAGNNTAQPPLVPDRLHRLQKCTKSWVCAASSKPLLQYD
eukprot:341380-Pelagomonas_calceolata.AAC.3